MTSIGTLGQDLGARGVDVLSLGMRNGWPDPRGLVRLQRLILRTRPHLIQTWMYHADLLGGLCGRLFNRLPVVWGVHHTDFDSLLDKRRTRWTVWACARLAGRLPASIVCCSEAARSKHADIGYPDQRMSVIHNGVATADFRPDDSWRAAARQELGLGSQDCLIGIPARFHPQKDIPGILQAMRILSGRRSSVQWVLCGRGMSAENRELMRWIREAGLDGRVTALGIRSDMARVMAAWDLASLGSSHGEGFPVSIAEAMSCGVPCVVTRVGDLELLVGDTGIVVQPRDPVALAEAWERMLAEGPEARRERGRRARRRIEENFGLARMVAAYERLYTGLAGSLSVPGGGG